MSAEREEALKTHDEVLEQTASLAGLAACGFALLARNRKGAQNA
ncbi:MAG TPA: hypothetical protein VGO90_17605 [Chthoniobacteraceae bacterium]|jgi:hypothetical protein|nr:hypothetical protein [Chthoniobacter sp.]HEV7869510.1 hypothetical protein [Chthoniobacteraceae bacterium]